MKVLDAIRGRRSIGLVKQDAVPKDKIEQLLDAAVWAPNHFHTQPWRFFVVTGEGRHALGDVFAAAAKENLADPDAPENDALLKRETAKPLRAPVVIAVAAVPARKKAVIEIEEICAVSAAIQNILLAAHSFGLGAIWRTGAPAYNARVKQFFGLQQEDHLLGFIYVGYPDQKSPPGKRTPAAEKTTWITEDR